MMKRRVSTAIREISSGKVSELIPRRAASVFALTAFVAVLGACDTIKTSPERGGEEIRSTAPVPSGRIAKGGGGILIGTQFSDPSKIGGGGCRMRIDNVQTKKSTFVPMKPEEPGAYLPLDPGTYVTRRLGCGVNQVWNLEDLYANSFKVESGKVSYLGKLIFVFKGDQLETVRKGNRIENSDSLASLLSRGPEGTRENLLSGFTGKAITPEMIDGPKREAFDVFALGVKDADRVLNPLLEKLKTCGTEEARQDPVRFGTLEYVAVYKEGHFVELRDRVDKNAFRDTFRACVENSMRDFRPDVSGEVRVRTRF